MVKLEEVMDEEFVREQEGPHDEDEWDTDSGTPSFPSFAQKYKQTKCQLESSAAEADTTQNQTWNPNRHL